MTLIAGADPAPGIDVGTASARPDFSHFSQNQALMKHPACHPAHTSGTLTCPCFNSPTALRGAIRKRQRQSGPVILLHPDARSPPMPETRAPLLAKVALAQGWPNDGRCNGLPEQAGQRPPTGGRPESRLDECPLRHKFRVNRGLVAPPRRCDIALRMQPSMVVLCSLVCLSPRSLSSSL
jgi:hypothetical protein